MMELASSELQSSKWVEFENKYSRRTDVVANQIDVDQSADHIGGAFKWEVEPKCKCGRVKEAVDEKFLFVSNFVYDGWNQFYMLPVDADGYLFRSNGLPISYCPWCGDEIKGKKKYPKSKK